MYQKKINFGPYQYEYLVEDQSSTYLSQYISSLGVHQVFIISDNQMPSTIIEELQNNLSDIPSVNFITFPSGEKFKTLTTVNQICERIINLRADRNSIILALGGGLTGNVAGMAASLLFRGLPLIHVPTTLMAASDSVLSLKQAVNLQNGKNLIGHYYVPRLVYININFLLILPLREIQSGLCETVKNLLVISPQKIEELSQIFTPLNKYSKNDYYKILKFCVEAKSMVMRDDPFEKKDALCLEYGHTIGHALELAGVGQYNHGEAVAYGLTCAAEISNEMGLLDQKGVDMHYTLLEKIGVNIQPSPDIQDLLLHHYLDHDNKRGYIKMPDNHIGFVLLRKLGVVNKYEGRLLTPVHKHLVKDVIKRKKHHVV